MELRYCEKCHGIIVLEGGGDPGRPLSGFVCTKCKSGAADPGRERHAQEVSAALQSLFEKGELNLFSASTVAIRKEQMELALAGGAGSKEGCHSPARSARRLQFRCPDCRAMLQTKRVEELCRTICPKCKAVLFLDGNGLASKTPPQGVSEEAKTSRMLRAGFRRTAQAEPKKQP